MNAESVGETVNGPSPLNVSTKPSCTNAFKMCGFTVNDNVNDSCLLN